MPQAPTRFLLRLAAYQAGLCIAGLGYWVRASFGDVTLDQALWHLMYVDPAELGMSEIFFVEAAVDMLLAPTALALVLAMVHTFVADRLAAPRRKLLRAVPALLGAGAIAALALQFSLFSYGAAYFQPDRFARDYVDPATVPLVAQHRRNLVLIYVESMEASYGDAAFFGRDLLAPLHALGGHSLGWYRPASGAHWTMAAMVATQCGVPLKVYSERDVRGRPGARTFLPGATCLGDVLHAQGYRNVFLGGVPLSFAGKGHFLRDHGYAEAWGREQWEGAGAAHSEFNAWGLWDSALLDHARVVLDRLHDSGQPFDLTLLTLDTHNPFGFMSPDCRREGVDSFEGIIGCDARHIADFLRYAQQRGDLEDTAVVVIGDHLAVPNPVIGTLRKVGARRGIFNLVLGKDLPAANRNELMPFDLFPTLLELAGVHVAGGRLGLGYSAVGPVQAMPPPGRAEQWSIARLNGSARYDQLWSSQPAPELPPDD